MNEQSTIQRLINELSKFPGIGRKTAERLAFHLLKESDNVGRDLAEAIIEVKQKVKFCSECGNLTEDDPCEICRDTHRNRKLICVVEEPKDIWAFEKLRTYKGVYHVLMGVISPLDGVGPEKLRIKELMKRIEAQRLRRLLLRRIQI